MKNKEEINAINGRIRELNEDELTEVVGGLVLEDLTEGSTVYLIGSYNGDSYGGHGTHEAAIGWGDLKIGRVFMDGRAAPVEIMRYGQTIGFTTLSSISLTDPSLTTDPTGQPEQ